MADRPRVLEFEVSVDRDRTARSGRGGSAFPREDAWSSEHLLLAALVRCTLTSLDFHVRRAGWTALGAGTAHGVVTKRESDARYAFVEIEARLEVAIDGAPSVEAIQALLQQAERGCFVGNSLTARPVYRWMVNGEETKPPG
jgi:organic hydroperoxide reductase OsmC/OhrA